MQADSVLKLDLSDMPKEAFTSDRATILNDIEIFNAATTYDIKCELLINPGKYLEHYSFSSFAYQKDFALTDIFDHHLQKFKQGIVKKVLFLWAYIPIIAKFVQLHTYITISVKLHLSLNILIIKLHSKIMISLMFDTNLDKTSFIIAMF